MAQLLDTNILIYFLNKKDVKAYGYIVSEDIFISVLTRMELLAGIKKENQKKKLKDFLDKIDTILVTEAIADQTGEILAKSSFYKKRQIDALIAATALIYNLELVTANVKDFRRIKGLKLEKFVLREAT